MRCWLGVELFIGTSNLPAVRRKSKRAGLRQVAETATVAPFASRSGTGSERELAVAGKCSGRTDGSPGTPMRRLLNCYDRDCDNDSASDRHHHGHRGLAARTSHREELLRPGPNEWSRSGRCQKNRQLSAKWSLSKCR